MKSQAVRYSLGLALAFGAVAVAYIVISGRIAANAAATVKELERIETLKGVLYVIVTTIAVGFGSYVAMRRIRRDAQELLRRERALVANQGRVLSGITAASIAHDANNVLMIALNDLDQLREHLPGPHHGLLDHVKGLLDRMIGLNRRLLSAHRPDHQADHTDLELCSFVRECVAGLRSHPSLARCQIQVHSGGHIELATQQLLVYQIITNLLLNAGEATGGQGRVEVACREGDGEAVIEVNDNGPGIPRDRRAIAFDTLDSKKPSGSGLGLFSVRVCVQSLGGTVEIDDSPLGGACLRVRLPHISVPALAH